MEVMKNNAANPEAKGKSRLDEFAEIYADDDADIEIEENEQVNENYDFDVESDADDDKNFEGPLVIDAEEEHRIQQELLFDIQGVGSIKTINNYEVFVKHN